jgi:hypothetical protein
MPRSQSPTSGVRRNGTAGPLLVGLAVALISLCAVPVPGQEKTIEVKVGDEVFGGGLKTGVNPNGYMHVYRLRTSADGVLSSVELLTRDDLQYLDEPVVRRDGPMVTISPGGGEWRNGIRQTPDRLKVVGPVFTRESREWMDVLIQPRPGVIYESAEVTLYSSSRDGLREEFKKKPSRFFALSYTEHVVIVDYLRAKNVNFKYVFREQPGVILATFCRPFIGDRFLEYSPPIEIRGERLHATDMQTNVTNYFILQAVNRLLSEVLFPSIFLPE